MFYFVCSNPYEAMTHDAQNLSYSVNKIQITFHILYFTIMDVLAAIHLSFECFTNRSVYMIYRTH